MAKLSIRDTTLNIPEEYYHFQNWITGQDLIAPLRSTFLDSQISATVDSEMIKKKVLFQFSLQVTWVFHDKDSWGLRDNDTPVILRVQWILSLRLVGQYTRATSCLHFAK